MGLLCSLRRTYLAASAGLLADRFVSGGAQLGTVGVGVKAGVGLGGRHAGAEAAGLVAAAGNAWLVAVVQRQVGAGAIGVHAGLGRGHGGKEDDEKAETGH